MMCWHDGTGSATTAPLLPGPGFHLEYRSARRRGRRTGVPGACKTAPFPSSSAGPVPSPQDRRSFGGPSLAHKGSPTRAPALAQGGALRTCRSARRTSSGTLRTACESPPWNTDSRGICHPQTHHPQSCHPQRCMAPRSPRPKRAPGGCSEPACLRSPSVSRTGTSSAPRW
eukprot:scaffold1166_cov261-Pinguiococcus_pyrenoidosus.AAC.15